MTEPTGLIRTCNDCPYYSRTRSRCNEPTARSNYTRHELPNLRIDDPQAIPWWCPPQKARGDMLHHRTTDATARAESIAERDAFAVAWDRMERGEAVNTLAVELELCEQYAREFAVTAAGGEE